MTLIDKPHHMWYNEILVIREADAEFEKQLIVARLTRGELWSLLAPLFMEEEHAGRYAVFLIHRHHRLEEGERMVAYGRSTRPSKNVSPNVVVDRWHHTGREFEHRYTEDPAALPPPPPRSFLDKFKSITGAFGIDTLGVCYAPPIHELPDGHTFLEVTGDQDREQVIIDFKEASITIQDFETSWIPEVDSDGRPRIYCGGMCRPTGCTKSPVLFDDKDT